MKKFINTVDLEKEVSCRCVQLISKFHGHITQLTMRACYKLVYSKYLCYWLQILYTQSFKECTVIIFSFLSKHVYVFIIKSSNTKEKKKYVHKINIEYLNMSISFSSDRWERMIPARRRKSERNRYSHMKIGNPMRFAPIKALFLTSASPKMVQNWLSKTRNLR